MYDFPDSFPNLQVTQIHLWRRGVRAITTAQLHSTKPELRYCAGSNPACYVSKIRDGVDLWQWSRLEIRLNASLRSTIPQKKKKKKKKSTKQFSGRRVTSFFL